MQTPKAAERAARYWTRRVAFEVAQLFPEEERERVELFALRHRLSVANAFHRRIVRQDVVQARRRNVLEEQDDAVSGRNADAAAACVKGMWVVGEWRKS